MTSARRLIRSATFDPADLKCLRDVFDEVWESIAPNYRNDAATVDVAQQKLATIILDLAKDGQLGPLQITRRAGRLMRLKYSRHSWFK